MKLVASILMIGVSAAMTSRAMAQLSESGGSRNVGETFSIELPAGAKLEGPTNGPDFRVYGVVKNGKKIVGMYLGNAADFPEDGVEFTKIGRCLAFIATKQERGQRSGDVLVPVVEGNYRSQLHLFYRGATPDVADLAGQIIASVQILGPRTCVLEHAQGAR